MIKRFLDITISASMLVIFFPVFLVIAWKVKKNLGTPVLFHQTRPGIRGKSFGMIKFRSMKDAQDASGEPLPDALRLTNFGIKLRATSLDELPELWNVLKGDMSLVGPRPLMMEYLALYNEEQNRRHEVRPGITGWAQINGRNAISWEEKFKLDVWYVDNQSLWLDMKIIIKTVRNVICKNDVNSAGEATTKKFTGSDRNE